MRYGGLGEMPYTGSVFIYTIIVTLQTIFNIFPPDHNGLIYIQQYNGTQ